jgi:hypothetical protein
MKGSKNLNARTERITGYIGEMTALSSSIVQVLYLETGSAQLVNITVPPAFMESKDYLPFNKSLSLNHIMSQFNAVCPFTA